ncbi:predicted protein [Histoplasma mississippiense (nom. inval.)]|uniref:predicted protein n=1 Tax=Ajellomyces capsulatus (strain NAm1 / WU24) TaxID=2059318 RepID=UPI000157D39C|nr:predicted protein [Histoplasma mississippiense (nom. inval.)]EDN04680.1 predicted protein [Histoplasma mississippiense (nom. inval.)]
MSLDMWWVALRSCITEPSLRCCAFFRGILPLRRGLGNSEYFHKSAGPVKKVMLTYNQNGTSRGIASITFIEVVLDASRAPTVPAVKPLTERVAPNPNPYQPRRPVRAQGAAATVADGMWDARNPSLSQSLMRRWKTTFPRRIPFQPQRTEPHSQLRLGGRTSEWMRYLKPIYTG